MARDIIKGNDPEEAASPVSSTKIRRATAETWPFGIANGAIEGFLRSLMPQRKDRIQDFGDSRLYPPHAPEGPPRLVQCDRKSNKLRCSGDGCEAALEGCVHVWEDRFRFRDLKDRDWVPPIALIRVFTKKGAKYEGVERYLPRPNPVVHGLKAATIMTRARVAMPTDLPDVLFSAVEAQRRQQQYMDHLAGVRRGRGQPAVDVYDLGAMAVLRIVDGLSYEELQERIERYAHEGSDRSPYLQRSFGYKRVVDAMTGCSRDPDAVKRAADDIRLSVALERIRDRVRPFFQKVVSVVGCDGMVLSTGATDNARTGHIDKTRGHQVTAHMMYDLRWGIVVAQRLTWHQRGRGSAEAPQYPYLLATACARFPGITTVLGDMAYGSARNRALSLAAGVRLYCPIKDSQFEGKAALRWLTQEQIDFEKHFCSLSNPLFRQVMPFRNKLEGWNEVQRSQAARNLISQVDTSRVPLTKYEKSKENPLRADLDLPDDEEERERIILEEQFVSRACHNEMLCREILSYLRAIVKAQEWYRVRVDFTYPRPFEPIPEDEEFSVFRPRIDPEFAA